MSLSLKLAGLPSSFSFHQGYNKIPNSKHLNHHVLGFSSRSSLPTLNVSFLKQNRFLQFFSINGDSINADGLTEGAADSGNSKGKEDSGQGLSLGSNEMLKKLRRYGVAGFLSYGLLNTAYYLTTFLLVWFYVAPVPGRMGYLAAVQRFLKVMAMVWAGSQVTKLLRAGGALALSPFVDEGLSWFTIKFKFESQGKAFMAIVAFCFGIALLLFLVVTLLWA